MEHQLRRLNQQLESNEKAIATTHQALAAILREREINELKQMK